jgi:hypothetical protein
LKISGYKKYIPTKRTTVRPDIIKRNVSDEPFFPPLYMKTSVAIINPSDNIGNNLTPKARRGIFNRSAFLWAADMDGELILYNNI